MAGSDPPVPFSFRRVVTGHDQAGKAIVLHDDVLDALPRVAGFFGRDIWFSSGMPVSNDGDVGNEGQTGTKGERTVIRIVEMPPGGVSVPIMHRTETLDYAVVLSGECDMELDSGERVHLRAGDVVIQRGTNHAWINEEEEPCRFLFVLIDANPVRIGDELLGDHLENFPPGHTVMPKTDDTT